MPSKNSAEGLTGRFGEFFRENRFLIIITALSVLVFGFSFAPEVVTPDGASYMLAGRQMLEGNYTATFFHRMPMLPSLFAAFYAAGLGLVAIRFIIPLFFVVLSLVSTFLLVREISDEKRAMMATVLMFCFTEFWRWGIKFLVDIPLLAISNLALYFFFKSLKDKKYFYHMGILMGMGLITKLSFVILPAAMALYVLAARRDVLRNKEPWLAAVVASVILVSAFAFVSYISEPGTDHLRQVTQVLNVEDAARQDRPALGQLITGQMSNVLLLLNMALFPILIFFPFGVIGLWKGRGRFLLFYLLLFFMTFLIFWGVRLRYYSPLYPVLMLLITEGFLFLRERLGGKAGLLLKSAFAVLLLVSFLNVIYIVCLDSEMTWGAERLSRETGALDGKIASDFLPSYLYFSCDPILNVTVLDEIFGNLDYGTVRDSGAEYIVISIYAEWWRSPSNETFHPRMALIEVPFMDRVYSNGRVPPDFTFRSELYRKISADSHYREISEVFNNAGQKIFIIYEVL